MNNKYLKILNPILLIVAIIQAGTGLSFFFWHSDLLHAMHAIAGPTLVILVIIHLIFNFGWIKMQYIRTKKGKEER